MRPSDAISVRRSKAEGAGKSGCPLHPQPRVRSVVSTRAESPQVHRIHPALPCAMVLTDSFALSPVIGLSCHRRLADTYPPSLTPASRRQDHTTSPSAFSALRLEAPKRPPHSEP